MSWTEAQVLVLRACWGKIRAQRIAEALGKTTNAIIGKADRLGLPRITREQKTAWLKEGYHESQWAAEHCAVSHKPDEATQQIDLEDLLRSA